MPATSQVMLILAFIACLSTASLLISWRTLRHLQRSARKAAQSMWSLHVGTHAVPGARGMLFYIRLSDPRRNRFRVGYIRVRGPRGAGVSAAEFRPAGPSGAGGYAHIAFKRVLSPNREILDRTQFEPGAAGEGPGEGRLYFFVTPRPSGLFRRARPQRLVVEVGVEEVAPDRDAQRLRLVSEVVDWTTLPDAAPAAAPALTAQAAGG